jgi:hypothetical protein
MAGGGGTRGLPLPCAAAKATVEGAVIGSTAGVASEGNEKP